MDHDQAERIILALESLAEKLAAIHALIATKVDEPPVAIVPQ